MSNFSEEWFTLKSITKSDNTDDLYCLSVDSDEKQFLVGEISVPSHNTSEGKAEDELKGEAQMILGSVARLGRAAGVHLVIATQRPDATLIPGETKANLGVRINCGRTDSNASNMILGNGEGTRVKANPRGRLYLRIYSNGNHGQGFFAKPSWIDDYLDSKGLNPDGTPKAESKAKKGATLVDMESFSDSTLDEREGKDIEAATNAYLSEDFSESDESYDDLLESIEEDSGSKPTSEVNHYDMGGLEFEKKDEDDNKWTRPEDSWDDDLDDLINENFQ